MSLINPFILPESKITISAVVLDSFVTKANKLQQAFQAFFDQRTARYDAFCQTSSLTLLGRVQMWEAEELGKLYGKVISDLGSFACLKRAGRDQEWEKLKNAIQEASTCSLITPRSNSPWHSCLEAMRKVEEEVKRK
jgi:hypothetical protein